MKIYQYIRLHMKNSITQIAHYNAFPFLRYVFFRSANCLFTNIQKQYNTLKSSLLFKKIRTLRANKLRIFGIQIAKFSGQYFHMNINIQRDFRICISVPLRQFIFSFSPLSFVCDIFVSFTDAIFFSMFLILSISFNKQMLLRNLLFLDLYMQCLFRNDKLIMWFWFK